MMVLVRWLLACGFVVSGGYRLFAALAGAALGTEALLLAAAKLVLGVLIAAGWQLRWTALLAAALVLVDAALAHGFWNAHGAARGAQLRQFIQGLPLVGGFLLLSLVSPRR
jgi:putative oxidoreductase